MRLLARRSIRQPRELDVLLEGLADNLRKKLLTLVRLDLGCFVEVIGYAEVPRSGSGFVGHAADTASCVYSCRDALAAACHVAILDRCSHTPLLSGQPSHSPTSPSTVRGASRGLRCDYSGEPVAAQTPQLDVSNTTGRPFRSTINRGQQ